MSAPGIAVPGTNVPASSLVSPGGAQGTSGQSGADSISVTAAAFTIPAVGATATVQLVSASWCSVGMTVMVAGADGAGNAAGLTVTAINGNVLTLLNPTPPASIPLASTATQGLLTQVSGVVTDYVGGDNACHDLGSALKSLSPVVRSYNSIGNSNFEVDARTAGGGNGGTGGWAMDRWAPWASSNLGPFQQTASPTGVIVSGTNFCVSSKFLRFTLTTQKTALATSDIWGFHQSIEGIRARELFGGPTSVLLVMRSSVANTTVSLSVRDPNAAVGTTNQWSFLQLVTLTNANQWYALSVPNIPVFASGGAFSMAPGALGYDLGICFACGSQYTGPSAGVWVSGNFVAAPGQGNFMANPVNSTFDVAYIGHEPGTVSNGILDKDWQTNLHESQRYFQKTYTYGMVPGTASPGMPGAIMPYCGSGWAMGTFNFPVEMAKSPTLSFWNASSGAAGTGNGWPSGNTYTVGSLPWGVNSKGFEGFNPTGPAIPAGEWVLVHYTADTGW